MAPVQINRPPHVLLGGRHLDGPSAVAPFRLQHSQALVTRI